jgi:hypothetical protein
MCEGERGGAKEGKKSSEARQETAERDRHIRKRGNVFDNLTDGILPLLPLLKVEERKGTLLLCAVDLVLLTHADRVHSLVPGPAHHVALRKKRRATR